MSNDSYSAIRGFRDDDLTAGRDYDSPEINTRQDSEDPVGVARVMTEDPSGRVIYLDREVMRSVSSCLLSDPKQFVRLKGMADKDHVRLNVVNDASTIDAIYFAQRIWRIPRSETLVQIPPLDGLYPGVAVRIRGFLRAKENLLTDRLTLISEENDRVRVEMANHGILSTNRSFLDGRGLFVVGQLRRLNPLVVAAGAILLLCAALLRGDSVVSAGRGA